MYMSLIEDPLNIKKTNKLIVINTIYTLRGLPDLINPV